MIRAFIAVDIDRPAKQKIGELISYLKQSNANVKWVNETQMHLTLKFLGNIAQDKIPLISGALEQITDKTPRFSLSLSDIGAFPNMNRPRVIWIDIDKGSDNLKTLVGLIEKGVSRLGFVKEGRGYKAHLTLGRVRSLKNINALTNMIAETEFDPSREIKVDKLTLFQSTLAPKGAIYTILNEFGLASE